ncbi:MAG: type II toxin-antitoxin system VapC family toxin [Gemmatimonadetes bacterium]|nr:type II toxin-antitoxin system VapC family toxin [Gemmatimonadota bacterium]MBT8402864.1 type II toxin-antitoxin system VapC family toxin [Gemmatimonadota bacterium]
MKVAYVDTSCLVALAFDEPGAEEWSRRLSAYDELVTANLTEAEFRAALRREGVEGAEPFLARLAWLLPDRPLGPEMERVLRARYLRGADLWHVACALYLAEDPAEVDFVTLDEEQRAAAQAVGFRVPN